MLFSTKAKSSPRETWWDKINNLSHSAKAAASRVATTPVKPPKRAAATSTKTLKGVAAAQTVGAKSNSDLPIGSKITKAKTAKFVSNFKTAARGSPDSQGAESARSSTSSTSSAASRASPTTSSAETLRFPCARSGASVSAAAAARSNLVYQNRSRRGPPNKPSIIDYLTPIRNRISAGAASASSSLSARLTGAANTSCNAPSTSAVLSASRRSSSVQVSHRQWDQLGRHPTHHQSHYFQHYQHPHILYHTGRRLSGDCGKSVVQRVGCELSRWVEVVSH